MPHYGILPTQAISMSAASSSLRLSDSALRMPSQLAKMVDGLRMQYLQGQRSRAMLCSVR